MSRKLYLNSFSQRFFLITAIIYLLDLVTGGRLGSLLVMNPQEVIKSHDYWRLMTYPFALGTAESIGLFAYTFLLVAPKLEKMLPKGLFPLLMIISLFIQSSALTLVFWKDSVVFTGMEGLSFFVLTLYVVMNLGKKTTYYYSPKKSIIFALLVVIVWFSSVLLDSFISGRHIMVTALALAVFGLGGGLLTFLQILLAKGISSLKRRPPQVRKIPEPEELRLAVVSQIEKKYSTKIHEEEYFDEAEEFVADEDRLNEILDKINEKGKDSLSPEELHYLQEYSKQL
jgi:membrane associated rhomboid family serine protease